MGGSSGGIPSLGGGGFFPSGPQFNPGALAPWDLGAWAQSGGMQLPLMQISPFDPPQQMMTAAPPPQQAAPRPSGAPGEQMGFFETIGALTGRDKNRMMEANRAARGGRYSGGAPHGGRAG